MQSNIFTSFVLVAGVCLVGCQVGVISGGDPLGAGGSGADGSGAAGGSSPGAGGMGTGGVGTGGTGGMGGMGGPGQAASSSSASSAASTGSGGGSAAVAQLCVDNINAFRATLGLPPYARWAEAEVCSDGEAQSDSITMTPHGAFGKCGEYAQNECPGWGGTPESIIGGCLQMMWDEGPGADFNTHGHYLNMSSQNYTQVACGFWTTPAGSVWAVQNFR